MFLRLHGGLLWSRRTGDTENFKSTRTTWVPAGESKQFSWQSLCTRAAQREQEVPRDGQKDLEVEDAGRRGKFLLYAVVVGYHTHPGNKYSLDRVISSYSSSIKAYAAEEVGAGQDICVGMGLSTLQPRPNPAEALSCCARQDREYADERIHPTSAFPAGGLPAYDWYDFMGGNRMTDAFVSAGLSWVSYVHHGV
ncbi:hypothetical protein LX36DRAFT_668507 [Colletotrichum falcatum]|nr:hypothetical protein LX36DRAFT_668507 [Colletotrichum falcatum]